MLTDEFRSFTRSVFRIDRTASPLGDELEEFQRWCNGDRTPPTEYEWLSPWLARIAQWRTEGKTFTRVRVLANPPTEYQRWLLWGTPWMSGAGEDIFYMSDADAVSCALPAWQWCMFDEARVIEMDSGTLITGDAVHRYRELRVVALRNSTTAERIAT